MNEVLEQPRELPKKSPYGDGNAAKKIVRIIRKELDL
jgi:UDP-N-acetylglucosamine 2-epimerase